MAQPLVLEVAYNALYMIEDQLMAAGFDVTQPYSQYNEGDLVTFEQTLDAPEAVEAEVALELPSETVESEDKPKKGSK